jgi:hypothetical protein
MDIKILRFKTEFRIGRPDVDWVEFTSRDALDEGGNPRHSTWEMVNKLRPPESIANDDGGLKMAALRSQWAQIEPHYLAWKEGSALPESGTPLGAWPGVNADQADALRACGVQTVEAVAAMTEALLMAPPIPNLREIKRQAAVWLEGRSSADLTARLAELEAQNAAMLEMLAEKTEPKRGPGRPPKQAEEAA